MDGHSHPMITRWASATPQLAPGWRLDVSLVAGFGVLTAALVWWPPLLDLDLMVRDWCDLHRPPPIRTMMWVLDHLGQGGALTALTVLVSFWLAWRHRTVRPILPAGLAPILSTLLIVSLKRWTARGAPHHDSIYLFSGNGQVHYPSGHVSNAIVYYGVLAMLLAPYLPVVARRLLQWLPGPLVLVGTTYVNYHWLTDSAAGFLLGLIIIRVIRRIPWWTMPLPPRLHRIRR